MRIAIIVEGGCLQSVYADTDCENVEVTLIDFDDADADPETKAKNDAEMTIVEHDLTCVW